MKLTITSSAQLSTHLKSLRKAKGWSQADLGQKLGIGQARVAQIESDPGSISVDRLLQIMHALDAKLMVDAHIEPQARQDVRHVKEPITRAVIKALEQLNAPVEPFLQQTPSDQATPGSPDGGSGTEPKSDSDPSSATPV